MRHGIAGRKLGRNTPHRKAMWRNMAISLLTHEQITTTLPKAKSLKPFVEKLITSAKQGDLAARRQVIKKIGNPIMIKHDEDPDVQRNAYGELIGGPKVVKKLFDDIAPRYTDRPGGYTRIIKLAKHRIGDGSDLCVLQLVTGEETGPQVSGKYSRRRDKANGRMARAAQLRKQQAASAAKPKEAEPTEQPDQASADATSAALEESKE